MDGYEYVRVCVCVCVCVLYIIFIRRAELLYRCPLPWSRLQTWGRKVAHTFCRTLPNSNSRLCLRHALSTGRCLCRCHCGLTARRIKRFQHIFCCITSVLCQAYHRYKEGIREKTDKTYLQWVHLDRAIIGRLVLRRHMPRLPSDTSRYGKKSW